MPEDATDAAPFPGHGREAHQTAAGIDFVNQAEIALFDLADPVKFVKLKAEIEKVKSGEKVLVDRIDDIDAFVENL